MHSEFCTMHSDNENNFNANIVAVYFLIICFKYVHAFQAMNISDIRAQFELIKRGIKRFHMCFGCVLYVVYAILRMNNKHATSHSFFFFAIMIASDASGTKTVAVCTDMLWICEWKMSPIDIAILSIKILSIKISQFAHTICDALVRITCNTHTCHER